MTLFEKFKWHTPLADYVAGLPASYPDSSARNFKDALWSYRTAHDCVATCAILAGDSRTAFVSAQQCVRASIEHFHGAWRQGAAIQSNQPRWKPYDWFNSAPDSLFWASVLGDWKAIRLLSQFPCVPPKWEWPDHAYFSLLGFFLRGESLDQHAKLIEFIGAKKKQQPKLLLECLMALESRTSVQFQAALERYLDYFSKHERNQQRLDLLQSRNASFYAAAAEHYGIRFDMPARYKDYVVSVLQATAA